MDRAVSSESGNGRTTNVFKPLALDELAKEKDKS